MKKGRGFLAFRSQFLALLLFLVIPYFPARAALLAYLFISLLCFLHARITRRAVRVTRSPALVRLYRSQSVLVTITVRNRSPLTVHHLLVFDHRGEMRVRGDTVRSLVLKPWAAAALSYEALADRRGLFSFGPAVVSASDPLGLFSWEKRSGDATRVIVYPWVFPLRLTHRHGLPGGAIRTDDPAYEDVTYFRSIREYSPGDDLRRVNWKVSARLASLVTMQYTPSLRFGALIVLNLTEDEYPLRYRAGFIESAIEAAASLIQHCVSLRQSVGLLARGRLDDGEGTVSYPVAARPGGAVPLLETLARIGSCRLKTDSIDALFTTAVRPPAGTRVWYVGPVPDEERLNRLCGLARRGHSPEFFFCDRQERVPFALKRLRFFHRFIDDLAVSG